MRILTFSGEWGKDWETEKEGWSTKKRIVVGILGFFVILVIIGGIGAALTGEGEGVSGEESPQVAEFEVSDLQVSSEEVSPSESVTVSVTVKNVGDAKGTYDVNLMVNGKSFENKKVVLKPNEEKTINFEIVAEESGTYNVSSGSLSKTFRSVIPFLEVLDVKQSPDGTVMQFKVKLYNTTANDILFGNSPIDLSYATFKLKTADGKTFKHYKIINAPAEIRPKEKVTFSVMFAGLPKDVKFRKIAYDAPAEKAVWAEIEQRSFGTLTGWLPVTEFSGSMLSDTLDKTNTFEITEEDWRINWRVEKIPFTPEGAVLRFSIVKEGEGKVGGDTIILLYEDVKEGIMEFHQKGTFHIIMLGKYLDWEFEIEKYVK